MAAAACIWPLLLHRVAALRAPRTQHEGRSPGHGVILGIDLLFVDRLQDKDGDWVETGLHIFFGAYPNMMNVFRCRLSHQDKP